LRKIPGPVQNEDGFWRIRMNYKLNGRIKKTSSFYDCTVEDAE